MSKRQQVKQFVQTEDNDPVGKRPCIEESEENRRIVQSMLSTLAHDLGIVSYSAGSHLVESLRVEEGVNSSLNALYDLQSQAKHVLEALDGHMNGLTYCEHTEGEEL